MTMMIAKNDRWKAKDLREFPVSRWNGLAFRPDFTWNNSDEYAKEMDKNLRVIGYSEGKWLLQKDGCKSVLKFDHVALRTENKPRLMNNRELFEWMFDRRGVKMTPTGWISMIHQYPEKDADKPVQQGVKVRPNGTEYFVDPTIDLL